LQAFPDQLFARNLRLDDLVRQCGINAIVIVWRADVVESIVSMLIAEQTGKWHSVNDAENTERVAVDPQRLRQLIHGAESNFADACEQWPIELNPIFVQYEQLFASDSVDYINAQMAPVFAQLGVKPCNWVRCYGKRQNPAPLKDKVINWLELPVELRSKKLDFPAIFQVGFTLIEILFSGYK
jgi:LPS sulfotransferase NodH